MNSQQAAEKLSRLKLRAKNLQIEIDYLEKTLHAKTIYTAQELLTKFLTEKQKLTCQLALDGKTTIETATQLKIAPKSVKWHFTRIFAVFGVKNKTELIKLLRNKEFEYVPAVSTKFTAIPERPAAGSTESCIRRLYDRHEAHNTRNTQNLASGFKNGTT